MFSARRIGDRIRISNKISCLALKHFHLDTYDATADHRNNLTRRKAATKFHKRNWCGQRADEISQLDVGFTPKSIAEHIELESCKFSDHVRISRH